MGTEPEMNKQSLQNQCVLVLIRNTPWLECFNFCPQLVALFSKIAKPLGGEAYREESLWDDGGAVLRDSDS